MIATHLIADRDYNLVRAALVRELEGDATAALVLTRIHWRSQGPEAQGFKGWWRGTAEIIAEETGLGVDQTRKAIDRLRKAGHIESKKFRTNGTWDQTLSYRVLLDEDPESEKHFDHSPNEHPDQSPNVQCFETFEDFSARADSEPDDEKAHGKGSDYRFDDLWDLVPTRRGRKVGKRETRECWRKLSYQEKRAAFQGMKNYKAECEAPDGPLAMDAHRWLTKRRWEDYQHPPTTGVNVNGHHPGEQVITAAYMNGDGVQSLPRGMQMLPDGRIRLRDGTVVDEVPVWKPGDPL